MTLPTVALALAGALFVGGCAAPAEAAAATTVDVPRAEQMLAELPVKGRAPKTGYSSKTRDELFPHWSDLDGDGCDTRAEILERDALPGTVTRNRRGCVVGATVLDPYTGREIVEEPGPASDVDVDHVVALSDAWQKGAQQLSAGERERLANDPLNLLAVDDGVNQGKGDGDAATWLPPNRAFRCEYVGRQVEVKAAYGLWVTAAERDAMARVLAGCR